VVRLVYGVAFAPDEGERLGDVEGTSKDSVLMSALLPRQYPVTTGQTAVVFAIKPERFRDAFAADLPPEQTAVMAATQRSVADLAFSGPSGPPAWKTCRRGPSSRRATRPRGRTSFRSMAERAGATITEVEGCT
jgi:hypothetical protein